MDNNNSILERAIRFKSLHEGNELFVIPNPWDAGSAKVLASLGFKALATTSAGLAYSLGVPDGHASISREQTLDNAKSIISACVLPVSADLENGYGNDPATCAETITLAAQAGLSGGSIEDATGNPADAIYPFELSVERVKAAVSAAKASAHPFMLTARAENFIYGRPDLKDTIKRLEAYAEAGADVLFAPGLKTADEIAAVVKAVFPRAVNVLMGLTGANFSIPQLQSLGVRRISIGSSLARAAYGGLFLAAEEIINSGTFTYAGLAKPYADLNKLFAGQ